MNVFATPAALRFISRVNAEAQNDATPHDGSVWGLWIGLHYQQGMVVGTATGEAPVTGNERIVWMPVDDSSGGRGADYGHHDSYASACAALPDTDGERDDEA